MELKNIVESLIEKKIEGSYWDFKQSWHNNNVDLLKDIICIANNITPDMRDGYIIFGIEDKTLKPIGVNNDSNRKSQENIIDFLSSIAWAGEEIPEVEVNTVQFDGKEIDVLVIYNKDVTPYYILKDYEKNFKGKNKVIVRAGVIYSRVGDRNTSSIECATKQASEFLWKKRFGLAGTDSHKVLKRLMDSNCWYSPDEGETFYNSEYGDIVIKRDCSYNLEVVISENRPETQTWVMDSPYLFSNMLNWNVGKDEIVRRAKWSIYLNGRKLDISLFGVQSTMQTYFLIEPNIYWDGDIGLSLNTITNGIKYYAYIQDSVRYLAFNIFFNKQCYTNKLLNYNKVLMVIPIFKNEQEHSNFINYVKTRIVDFKKSVENQDIDEMFPEYAKNVPTVIVYKLGKTMVQWLDEWRYKDY